MENRLSLSSALAQLDPQRITAGRELRALTKKALAERINKTPSAITQFESGKSGLDIETFAALTLALGLPPSFFISKPDALEVDFSTCHFRANRSVPQCERRKAFQLAINTIEVFRTLESHGIAFPKPDVPTYDWHSYSPPGIEKLAQSIRTEWGLESGPILNMAALLESKGVFVILLPEEFSKLDAFSFWAEDRPCVVTTQSVSASRMQFDHGHELAHLILHMEESAGDPEAERAANHFSGAFLAPAHSFRRDCPRSWDYTSFLQLKKRWRISMQASLYRGRQLGIIKDSSYRWGMIQLSTMGQRINESGEFEKPLPSMLCKAFNLIRGHATLEEISFETRLSTGDLESLLISQNIPQETIDACKGSKQINPTPNVHYIKRS